MKLNRKLITLIILTFNIYCYSQFSGGSGTEEDPYQIATAEDLNNIRYYLTSNFIQTADIDLGVAPWNEGEGWDPIGDYNLFDPLKSFRGNYDGDSFTIFNLYINRPSESYLGLFASSEDCVLEDISIKNYNIIGGAAIGGLVAISYNDDVSNCIVNGTIVGGSELGLLIYFFEGYNIKDCHAEGDINAERGYVGGLISMCNADSVRNCSAKVTITANANFVGGFFGYCIDTDLIENCYSESDITAQNCDWVGGFIGGYPVLNNPVTIKYSFSKGALYSNPLLINTGIGGFIGQISGYEIATIQNCYSSVEVTGNDKVGGFAGSIYEYTSIQNCYSTGQVTGNTNVGGFAGIIQNSENVTITNSYWDTETSGIDSSAAGEGRTTPEMTLPYSGNTYVGWDFVNVWKDDTANQNNGYPTFLWVSGIEEDDDYMIPETSRLYQNYPNPFNPVTQIRFDLAKTGNVKLSVYNINGQKVAELLNGVQNAGIHTVEFDGSYLNSGVYYYTLEADSREMSRKMLLVK
ncbi:MAG TPA: GLUG motif-containing protein [Clostridiales bacterium]|nr:GLUG motif-containing protein [Clostridiales bacterium]